MYLRISFNAINSTNKRTTNRRSRQAFLEWRHINWILRLHVFCGVGLCGWTTEEEGTTFHRNLARLSAKNILSSPPYLSARSYTGFTGLVQVAPEGECGACLHR